MMKNSSKLAVLSLAGALLAGTVGQAFAQDYRYGDHDRLRSENRLRHDRQHGLGVGGAVAAGILGGAALGAAGAYGTRPTYNDESYAARPSYGDGYSDGERYRGSYRNDD